ncbi:MAG: hypothetical protein IT379_13010, partial [Deltaproteobacteria bacterium]|nr:hypothetical protein [Deltaproteobacteria bacterium]
MLLDNYVSLYFFGPELTLIAGSLLIAIVDMLPLRRRKAGAHPLEDDSEQTSEERASQLSGIALLALGISAVMALWNLGVAPRPL